MRRMLLLTSRERLIQQHNQTHLFSSSSLYLLLQLTHAVMDQLSGAFLYPLLPVERVEAAAKAGREATVRKRLSSFNKHTADMEKVATT